MKLMVSKIRNNKIEILVHVFIEKKLKQFNLIN
jgi:hypothetical protein